MVETSNATEYACRSSPLSWSGYLCLVYSVLGTACIVHALLSAAIGPQWDLPDPEEMWHARVAVLLLFSSVVAELCFLLSSSVNLKEFGWNMSSDLKFHGAGDSFLTLAEYTTKLLCALYLWHQKGGVIHTDVQAFGGSRPVYIARFVQWSVGVPLLVLITNRGLLSGRPNTEVLARSTPSLLASFVYIWVAWVMEVTTGVVLRWVLFTVSMLGHVVVSMDQLRISCDIWGEGEVFGLRFGMLVYQLVSFTGISCVFVMGRFGVISSLWEQAVYAYVDATIKVFQGAILAMIRNRESLCAIHRWWTTAGAATQVLEDLVHKARVPVFSLDKDARVTSWNQNLQFLTGLTFDDVKNKNLMDVVCAHSKDSVETVLKHVATSAEMDTSSRTKSDDSQKVSNSKAKPEDVIACSETATTIAEMGIPTGGVQNFGPDGLTVRQLAMTFVPISGDTGECAGYMAIGQDLSELSELRITQAKKSTLMGMLSHELRSPLHGMVGLTGALLETENGKAMHRQLSMVRGCAARLLDLVNNIMDLAQIEKKKSDSKPTERPTSPVDMASIVDEVITMTQSAVDKTNKPLLRPSVRLVNNVADKQVPLIPGDPYKLTQVIYNLMTNACKFTERGSVSLSSRHLPETQRLEIDVTDTGRGISKEGQKRIFKPFEQEQNGDARNFQGVGLGLAVCTEIAELHSGELRVSSELGRGSTFTLSLFCDGNMGLGEKFSCNVDLISNPTPPAVQSTQVHATPPLQASLPSQATPPLQATLSILHKTTKPLILSVDDDEVNQEVVRNALSQQCDVFCAMNGEQALKFLQRRKQAQLDFPDVVLLDIQMPGMSGFEVCEEMRQTFESAHAKMPIIMVSARAPQNQTMIQSFETGTSDFLAKPFDAEVLRHKVKVAVSMKEEAGLSGCISVVVKEAAAQAKASQDKLEQAEQKN